MARVGRPSILDAQFEKQRKKFLLALRTGNSVRDAARASRLGLSSVMRAMERGRRKGKAHAEFREFREQVHEAIAESKMLLVSRWHNASRTSWKAAAAMLRARYPHEYAVDVIAAKLVNELRRGDDEELPEITVRRMSAAEQAKARSAASERVQSPDAAAAEDET